MNIKEKNKGVSKYKVFVHSEQYAHKIKEKVNMTKIKRYFYFITIAIFIVMAAVMPMFANAYDVPIGAITPKYNGDINSRHCSPEGTYNGLECCDGLKLFDPKDINVLAQGKKFCYDPNKGMPYCDTSSTLSVGWYYPNGRVIIYDVCYVPQNVIVKELKLKRDVNSYVNKELTGDYKIALKYLGVNLAQDGTEKQAYINVLILKNLGIKLKVQISCTKFSLNPCQFRLKLFSNLF
jgi:hypothetical protein